MASPAPQLSSEHYVRTLLVQGTLIESRCRRCGFVIIGKASERLPEDEKNHLSECAKQRVPPRSGG